MLSKVRVAPGTPVALSPSSTRPVTCAVIGGSGGTSLVPEDGTAKLRMATTSSADSPSRASGGNWTSRSAEAVAAEEVPWSATKCISATVVPAGTVTDCHA